MCSWMHRFAEVGAFLDSLGMGSYKKVFLAQEINGDALVDLSETDLLSLKMKSPSERYLLVVIVVGPVNSLQGKALDGNWPVEGPLRSPTGGPR